MKIKITVLSLITFCFFFSLEAQDSTIYRKFRLINLSSGYGSNVLKDDIISPLLYRGANTPIESGYKFISTKHIQTASIFYSKLELKSSISDGYFKQYTNSTNILLEYSYNRKVVTFPKIGSRFFLGAKLVSESNSREHYYNYYYNIETEDDWLSLDINLIFEKWFEKHRGGYFYFNINMPLVAYSSSNEYYNYFIEVPGKRFFSIDKLLGVQTTLSFTKLVTKRLGLEIKYQLNFYSKEQYSDLFYSKYLSQNLLTGLIIKI